MQKSKPYFFKVIMNMIDVLVKEMRYIPTYENVSIKFNLTFLLWGAPFLCRLDMSESLCDHEQGFCENINVN